MIQEDENQNSSSDAKLSPRPALEGCSMPKQGYTCFHCGDRFTTVGAAQDHFGGTEGALAACRIKFGDELGLVMELRKAEASRDEWMNRALRDESEIERLECRVQSLTDAMQSYKPFRECRSINDVFFLYDAMEGRALAAEERWSQLGPFDDTEPLKAALLNLADDIEATDKQRRVARMALGELQSQRTSD